MTETFYAISVKGRDGKTYYLNYHALFLPEIKTAARFPENDWAKIFNTVLSENISPITVLRTLQVFINHAKEYEENRGKLYRLDFSKIRLEKIVYSEEVIDELSLNKVINYSLEEDK